LEQGRGSGLGCQGQKELCNGGTHLYNNVHFVYGQKPEAPKTERHDLFVFCLLARFDKGKRGFKEKKGHILQVCAGIVWYYGLVAC